MRPHSAILFPTSIVAEPVKEHAKARHFSAQYGEEGRGCENCGLVRLHPPRSRATAIHAARNWSACARSTMVRATIMPPMGLRGAYRYRAVRQGDRDQRSQK